MVRSRSRITRLLPLLVAVVSPMRSSGQALQFYNLTPSDSVGSTRPASSKTVDRTHDFNFTAPNGMRRTT